LKVKFPGKVSAARKLLGAQESTCNSAPAKNAGDKMSLVAGSKRWRLEIINFCRATKKGRLSCYRLQLKRQWGYRAPDKLDYDSMTRVVAGMDPVIQHLANASP
jgi:hypothetical protein